MIQGWNGDFQALLSVFITTLVHGFHELFRMESAGPDIPVMFQRTGRRMQKRERDMSSKSSWLPVRIHPQSSIGYLGLCLIPLSIATWSQCFHKTGLQMCLFLGPMDALIKQGCANKEEGERAVR